MTRAGFGLRELLIGLAMTALLAGLAVPGYIRLKDKAREGEARQGLHQIQLQLERYAVDSKGSYPHYLCGGDNRYSRTVRSGKRHIQFEEIAECRDSSVLSDVLLRKGYLDAYPANPFARTGLRVHQAQQAPNGDSSSPDPLRNASRTAMLLGTRFGADCSLMGNVLGDPRWPERSYETSRGETDTLVTGAGTDFGCYDIWQPGQAPRPFLPGQFFYKATGPIVAVPSLASQTFETTVHPSEVDQYFLGLYGSSRTKGYDVLSGGGEQSLTTYRIREKGAAADSIASFEILENRQFAPNGIADSVILVLTAGEDQGLGT